MRTGLFVCKFTGVSLVLRTDIKLKWLENEEAIWLMC